MTMPGRLLRLDAAVASVRHLLPRWSFRPGLRAALLVLVGFIVAQGALTAAFAGLGLVPKGPFHNLLQREIGYGDERPVVLVIGSSFSAAGVDPDALANRLSGAGRAVAVQRLAVPGAPHIERLYYLKEYLAQAPRKPELVLFEVAGGYDSSPLYQIYQMRFSDRMIAMMDGSSAWWGLRWLAGADELGFRRRLTLATAIFGQWALHTSHIGYIWNSAPSDTAVGRDPDASPAEVPLSDGDTARLLDQAVAARDLKSDWPPEVPTRWMSAFLAEEIATLQHYGVHRFAFYSVPSMQGANVAYARRFCTAVTRQFLCIVGEDPDLLAALRFGADWQDFDHLQGAGREIFTHWLGDRLVEARAWP